jgi:hypothetical protein
MKVYGFVEGESLAPLGANRFHLICFEYEKDNFTITPNINEADIIPIKYLTDQNEIQSNIDFLKENNVRHDQILVMLHIFHAGDGDPTDPEIRGCFPYHNAGYKTVYVTTDYKKPVDSIKSICYDHMFNRQKAYFTEYDKFDLKRRLWSFNATKAMYELNEITNKTLVKKFLIPNKTYEKSFFTDMNNLPEDTTERSRFRKYLKSTILESDCYFSSPDNWIYLNSQEMSEIILNDYHYYSAGMGFHPLANNYYETSAVSVYVETCVETLANTKIVTEKSFNPFVKGHFVLPFSYQYYVRDIQEIYGFKLPEWIDYTYDNIADDNERFLAFMKSFSKIRFKSLQELQDLCNRDIDILKYNRNIFFERNYDNLYNKLRNSINILNGN